MMGHGWGPTLPTSIPTSAWSREEFQALILTTRPFLHLKSRDRQTE